jgi:hypothetical protein
MDLRQRRSSAEQVCDGRVLKPMPVPPPLGTRIDERVKHEGLQDLIPAGALAAGGKSTAPEPAPAQWLP